MDWNGLRVHFIGIGGSGMSGIARIVAARGGKVSGSDYHDSSILNSLRTIGIEVSTEHDAKNIASLHPGTDIVVRSSAVAENNVEIVAARAAGISVMQRAEFLALLLEGYRSVAIAGTHGKTTTTSMLTVALQHARRDPSFVIGATIRNSGTNAHQGSGDIFVVEADESDGSFTAYKPEAAIVTNIELDHVDNFQDISAIDLLFKDFVGTIKKNGVLVACSDDDGVLRLLTEVAGQTTLRVSTYGEKGDPELRLDRIVVDATSSRARVTHQGRVLGEIQLSIPGRHNLFNAAAALLMGIHLGIPAAEMIAGLALFTGARRRFEIKGIVNGITVVDDYGHHPTEVRATLETARTYAGSGRVLTIFQPHRFSRTRAFTREFAEELGKADHTFLLEVYPAGESPIPGVSSLSISQRMAEGTVTYEPSMPVVIESVIAMATPGDLILTLGAGDVSSLGTLIVTNLQSS